MENIRFGKVDASDEEVYAAAREANAHEFITSFPEGYNIIVGECRDGVQHRPGGPHGLGGGGGGNTVMVLGGDQTGAMAKGDRGSSPGTGETTPGWFRHKLAAGTGA